ncbi:unnamed protein product [Ceutorhynchus assimilis]|uniref:A-kinase anchor protein 9 n=1 Tax=Ceutorhynchus assimilis TaxID=467358 RepID=A0A9N9N1Z6_9CUCU|nr:unnamed protein product [Ceutorhynchus assimilis]
MEEHEDHSSEEILQEKESQEDDNVASPENSISEHITSNSGSIENDRSFQEIEVFNQPSAFENAFHPMENISQEQKPSSLDLSSFGSYGLLDNMDRPSRNSSRNAKSVLEEILANTEFDLSDDKEESFNLFANLDLSDKSLVSNKTTCDKQLDLEKDKDGTSLKVKQLVEIVAMRDTTINALTQELDSFREMSNPTYTSSMVSVTEYKQLQEECHNKIMECNSIIAVKNDQIQKLSESLDQTLSEKKELLNEVNGFKEEIAQLQQQLQETAKMVENHQCVVAQQNEVPEIVPELEVECLDVEKQKLSELVEKLQNEVIDLKDQMKLNNEDYANEIASLQDLLESTKRSSEELVEKHSRDLKDLREYFEKKCVELEKNYSEEVFSQQSRKLSGSSSEADLSGDFLLSSQPGPDGDGEIKIFKSKEDVEKFKETLSNFVIKLSKHSLEDVSDKTLINIEIEVRNELNALLKIGEKLEIKAVESKYLEEISDLRYQLDIEVKRHRHLSICSAAQEVVSSGDFELTEVVQSYERRLQEQIAIAKIDLVNELETQIQRLVSNESDEEELPSELRELRERFTAKYEAEIQDLKEKHEIEVTKLKDDHLKILNGALERARRRSLKDESSKSEIELLKERDSLKKQVISLRNLLSELVQYFTQAEDELNNTLVDNLVKQNNETSLNLSQLEADLNQDSSSGGTTNSSRVFDSLANKTRVHFAPNFGELINMIEHQSQHHDESIDISIDLKNELGMCLEKLKQEANAILTLTALPKGNNSTTEEQIALVSKQLVFETQHRDRLKAELVDANLIIAALEKEKEVLEARSDELFNKVTILESDLEELRYKMAELIENGQAEVISVGYGEGGNATSQDLGDTMTALADIHEQARTMLAHSRTSADPNVLRLIEELCRVGEKIKEEAKKESRDLLQQIEVADKKYKTTQKFLEDQAVEREQERDEAQKKIDNLCAQLKNRDKDKAYYQIMTSEVEELQQQIHDLNHIIEDQSHKFKELESERDEAVEKIQLFRDIVRDLEEKNDTKGQQIRQHLRDIEKLEYLQNLRKQCDDLQEEVQKLRIGAELAGSEGALKQIKIQIHEIELDVDKKTQELEQLHSTGRNSCSSRSEDMSVGDLLRARASNAMDECEVPLQQLARLKEKLTRHTRAEEAAIKRINDLEMLVSTLKTEIEEATNEKEFLKRQIQEQIVLLSDFQIRLDQQRIKAEHIEKQTNTSLETKIYDLQNEIVDLREKLRNKDKTIHLQETNIKDIQRRLKDRENDIATAKDDELVVDMQKELEVLRQENQQMKDKLSTDNQILPNLVENIIQDKNHDIEKLREKLTEAEKLLFSYTSLNLDKNDLRTLAKLKNAGGSIEQLISILDLSQPIDQMRRYDNSRVDFSAGEPFTLKKNDDTEFLGSTTEPEISSIEKIGPANLHYTMAAPLGKPNSTELHQKSAEKRVHFQDSANQKNLTMEIEILRKEIEGKNKIILEMEAKIEKLNDFEEKMNKLQVCLDETEKALTNATRTFEKEQEEARENLQKLGVQLAEKKMQLSERDKEIQLLKEDSQRKDSMYFQLANEKRELDRNLEQFEKEHQSYEEINTRLVKELENKDAIIEHVSSENESSKEKLLSLQKEITHKVELIEKLREQITQNDTLVVDLKSDVHILNEDLKYYQNQATELEKKVAILENPAFNKQAQEEKLKKSQLIKEVAQLNDLLREKEALIEKMTEDQENLHSNLVSIDNKIKERGNIFDLNDRLKNEQKKNADLYLEIHKLKASLFNYEMASNDAVDEITGQVKEELACAAQIDSNILNAVSDHSLSSISEGQDVEYYMNCLKKQKIRNKHLLQVIDGLKKQTPSTEQQENIVQQKLDEMQRLMENDNIINQQKRIEDAKLMEHLRIKLEGALDYQEQLQKALEEERLIRKSLEIQCEDLKKPTSSSDSTTKYKSLPVQGVLERVSKELEIIKQEKANLMVEFETLKQNNSVLDYNLKYTKKMLNLEIEKNRTRDEEFRALLEKERKLFDEFSRKKCELETKEREIEEKKIKMAELEHDKKLLKKQKADLMKALKTQTTRTITPSIENAIAPEAFENLRKELVLKSNYITQLLNEKKMLENLANNEIRNSVDGNMPYEDLVARCNFLFAKTMRLDSVKKILIWQKCYLIDYLRNHQRHCLTAVLPRQPHEDYCLRRKRSPLQYFRAAVYTLISIERMKFLVRRWHSGIRKYEKVNARHYQSSIETFLKANLENVPKFHVGQPLRHHPTNPFSKNIILTSDPRSVSPTVNQEAGIVGTSWSGFSPPSKETRIVGSWNTKTGPQSVTREDSTPLQAPQLLAQLQERVDQIQDRLSIPFSTADTLP